MIYYQFWKGFYIFGTDSSLIEWLRCDGSEVERLLLMVMFMVERTTSTTSSTSVGAKESIPSHTCTTTVQWHIFESWSSSRITRLPSVTQAEISRKMIPKLAHIKSRKIHVTFFIDLLLVQYLSTAHGSASLLLSRRRAISILSREKMPVDTGCL